MLSEEPEKLGDFMRLFCDIGDEEFYYGFPDFEDARHFVRSLLYATKAEGEMRLNLTDVLRAGYYSGEEQLTVLARERFRGEFTSTATTIILTEGSTDTEFLSAAMQLLYPKMCVLYSFIDFDAKPKWEGGAGNLAKVVKSFIRSGVANRVIALFDNDTAAHDTVSVLTPELGNTSLRVMHYPNLPIANNYPTLGPSGNVNLDVNTLAGSIEMYFGEDVLRSVDGKLAPVQWMGYNQKLKRYQGALISKAALQESFRNKLATADMSADWSGMKSILEEVFAAFRGG